MNIHLCQTAGATDQQQLQFYARVKGFSLTNLSAVLDIVLLPIEIVTVKKEKVSSTRKGYRFVMFYFGFRLKFVVG